MLTAKHLFDTDAVSAFSLGYQGCTNGVGRVFTTMAAHPTADVAVAALRHDPPRELALLALPAGIVAADYSERADDYFLVGGFPAAFVGEETEHANRTNWQWFSSTTYGCHVEGRDPRGRFRIVWGDAVGNDPEGKFAHLGVKHGEVHKQPRPHGISGGALWRFGVGDGAKVWAPSDVGRIVGVASAWLDPHEFAEPVEVWGDWFRDWVSTLDEA